MTRDQKDTATVWIYGVFCLAMLGVYAYSCWQGNRSQRRLHEQLVKVMAPPPYVVVPGEVVGDQAELGAEAEPI